MTKSTNNSRNSVLVITSYPPRECGIASYSKDLNDVINQKFGSSFSLKVCAIEKKEVRSTYPKEVINRLDSSELEDYFRLAEEINNDDTIKMVFVQHEFGLFGGDYGEYLNHLITLLKKPVIITFHTVLSNPEKKRKAIVSTMCYSCKEIVVMTKHSSDVLQNEYGISESKISIIPHGSHIIPWKNKHLIKQVYQFENRLVLTTFGLLGPNKSIETALDALPNIIKQFPTVIYLILGKTHPEIVLNEGEVYRNSLEKKIEVLGLEKHVMFINKYLELPELLEYLHLTDIYLFTSKDPCQTVSGTFTYAMSCGCPIISTPIPHAFEMLKDNMGRIVDFNSPDQFSKATIQLLEDEELREQMAKNAFHQTRNSVWENSAISHAKLFHTYCGSIKSLDYAIPEIKLEHLYSLTDDIGMIQFSDICYPDINSGYTLDDNARAMITMCMHYDLTRDQSDLKYIFKYLSFIECCQQTNGDFLNYVDKENQFHLQNELTNLEDSNGRAIWALGMLISFQHILPVNMVEKAKFIIDKSLLMVDQLQSPRAMAFTIKGLYFFHKTNSNGQVINQINNLSNKLMELYKTASTQNWAWFEGYLTYANSVLPESMLYAYLATNNLEYKLIAHLSFDFLLSCVFIDGIFKPISNASWYHQGSFPNKYGEQPIEASYMIQALNLFRTETNEPTYLNKIEVIFSWYLGNNHLNKIIYNPKTGGCYDGLEEHNVNLNQGAESTVCYLIARFIVENIRKEKNNDNKKLIHMNLNLNLV